MKIIEETENFASKRPNCSAAIILSLLVLIFISPSFFQGRYLAPVDTTHYVAPYLDITTQMLPWWNLSKDIIHSGHFPFWNIFSGNGLPLMANMQSAIFFPLTWLFYIFSVRFALAAYAFLKLLLMGMFTFLYLRELKLKFSSSLLGAILFAFCNANVIWFLWPLTSVILILPLSFFLIEKYFNNISCVIPSPGATGEESVNNENTSAVINRSLHSSDALVGRDGTLKLKRYITQPNERHNSFRVDEIRRAFWPYHKQVEPQNEAVYFYDSQQYPHSGFGTNQTRDGKSGKICQRNRFQRRHNLVCRHQAPKQGNPKKSRGGRKYSLR
jgi:hypothetical protein